MFRGLDVSVLAGHVPNMENLRTQSGGGAMPIPMRLDEYLIESQISPSAFARRIGVGRATVHRYISGERFPEPQIIHRIHSVTEGRVNANDLMRGWFEALERNPGDARPEYPWTRETRTERLKADRAFQEMMDEPNEGADVSPVIREALKTLGMRSRIDEYGDLYLDGRKTRPADIVKKANVLRWERRLPKLHYPGA